MRSYFTGDAEPSRAAAFGETERDFERDTDFFFTGVFDRDRLRLGVTLRRLRSRDRRRRGDRERRRDRERDRFLSTKCQ